MSEPLRAPFPYFGGKRPIAAEVWKALGPVKNYVEPFFGSGAVLLGRPPECGEGLETVNDLNGYLANAWRAIQADPDGVAAACDWPVNEIDILARHRWLLAQDEFRARMLVDPDYYDVRIAGWWIWGACAWFGRGWCSESDANATMKLPHLGSAGQGVHRLTVATEPGGLQSWMRALSERLRRVRVASGDWSRVMGDSVTVGRGLTGVFLDPPYSAELHSVAYAGGGDADVATEVRAWCLEHGADPRLRIVLCGYGDEHSVLDAEGWSVVAWKTRGGFGNQCAGRGRENAGLERLWLSPGCLSPAQASLW